MIIKNFYPEVDELPYKRTTASMPDLVIYAKTLIPIYGIEVIRTAYCIIRNESANLTAGVNGNYAGIQGDDARWSGITGIIGTVVKKDSGGAVRRFLAFDPQEGYKQSFEFLCRKVKDRGIYIGGNTHKFTSVLVDTPDKLAISYCTEWSRQQVTEDNSKNFKSLYRSSLTAFPG